MKAFITITASVLMLLVSVHAGERPVVRPSLGLSVLTSAPSADALGYVDADGGNLDRYLDQKKISPFIGVQVFMPWKNQLFLGGELSFRRLFSSTFNTGSSDLEIIDEDQDTDSEHALSFLGIVEYRPVASKFFFQGGAGFHVVHWEFNSDYSSKYSYSSKSYGGTATNLGLMGAAGMRVPLSPNLVMPVMARFDYIMRYSAMLPVTVTASLEFSL